jgi:hypothetical protein
MGFFGKFAYSNGRWAGEKPSGTPSLVVDIHDSDIATIDYRPTGGGTGRFYLGTEPRVYFEDETASAPVDTGAEARAFAGWVRQVTGRDVGPDTFEELMPTAEADAEPVDVFVEDTVQKLLALAGLPLPRELTAGEDDLAQEAQPAKRRGWFRSR